MAAGVVHTVGKDQRVAIEGKGKGKRRKKGKGEEGFSSSSCGDLEKKRGERTSPMKRRQRSDFGTRCLAPRSREGRKKKKKKKPAEVY